jgi:hypothetical protein
MTRSERRQLERQHTKASKAPLFNNLDKKRAIHLTVKSDGKDLLQSFFVYNESATNELKEHNKKYKVTAQTSVDTFLDKNILSQSIALVQDRLDIGSTSPADAQKQIVSQLMYSVGSIVLSNEYFSIWGETKDIVFNLSIDIDTDGFFGVNQFKDSPEHQIFNCRKGVENAYNEVKSELNLVSFS